MEEMQLNQVAVTHLLQHTLRSFCIHENSQWVYAVFWRILPRNYPPPKWDGVAYDRSRSNRRNWILVWEDGFCNFAAATTTTTTDINPGDCSSSVYADHEYQQSQGLQPELFFKMSHEIYNYGEGLIGKVAADHSHKWIYKEASDQEINFLSAWHNSADSHPRTWEAQFQSGIKTIALIAVREGVIQLGSMHKVTEDLSYMVLLRKKFSYIESIPGVLLPHPSSSSTYTLKAEGYNTSEAWHYQGGNLSMVPPPEFCHRYNNYNPPPLNNITPSMSSLEALLSKLPSVVPVSSSSPPVPPFCEAAQPQYLAEVSRPPMTEYWGVAAKEEVEAEDDVKDGGECSSSMTCYDNQEHYNYGYHHHHDLNVSSCMNNNGY
ncbi:protein RICE SALT SENSITIVE 3-like [Rutidosis leptorrhynchoides]|uniref:protein RICE SALT SENSITIVE 3-like n=1 Tax=Rutidosis leptorrhynchoides TaxID=125765 RepID=UPI003A9999EB